MKLFKHAQYNKEETSIDLRTLAAEIVDHLAHRWPWEDAHKAHIEYVLDILNRVKEQRT